MAEKLGLLNPTTQNEAALREKECVFSFRND